MFFRTRPNMFDLLLVFQAFACLSRTPTFFVQAQCSNMCSNHGVCNNLGQCDCADGFRGADCSQRACPYGAAFSDPAASQDAAHGNTECSGRGTCDEISGACVCEPGFTGIACERTTCANDCHHRGRCVSYRQMALDNFESQRVRYDNVWDADKTYGCLCDEGYQGYDCSLSVCPSGDDPLTPGGVQESQLLYCNATTGSFVLNFGEQRYGTPSITIGASFSEVDTKKAIESIPRLGTVSVTFSSGVTVCSTPTKNIVTITFLDQFGPVSPLVPTLLNDMNAYAAVDIGTDDTNNGAMTDSFGTLFQAVKGTKENDVCSHRGVCDTGTGTCRCFERPGGSERYAGSDGYGGAGDRGDCGYAPYTISDCPGNGNCNNHGVCNNDATKRCDCQEGFAGGDCSQRTCPVGRSWFSYPSSTDVGHDEHTECSEMGACDRNTGECKCNFGYFGAACEYMACPSGDRGGRGDQTTTSSNQCSGHGSCLSMRSLATYNKNGDGTPSPQLYGKLPNDPLTWDADRVFGCLCDEGYTGYDCSLRECPTGTDPVDIETTLHICSRHGLCNSLTGLCKCFRGWGSSDGAGNAGPNNDCGHRKMFRTV